MPCPWFASLGLGRCEDQGRCPFHDRESIFEYLLPLEKEIRWGWRTPIYYTDGQSPRAVVLTHEILNYVDLRGHVRRYVDALKKGDPKFGIKVIEDLYEDLLMMYSDYVEVIVDGELYDRHREIYLRILPCILHNIVVPEPPEPITAEEFLIADSYFEDEEHPYDEHDNESNLGVQGSESYFEEEELPYDGTESYFEKLPVQDVEYTTQDCSSLQSK
ncbi:hypothetical protein C8J56DRAFT_889786 [Mycena floridula]|nr:hypothetical protein C8J56DRAFT_889786 [Mycena floridula]